MAVSESGENSIFPVYLVTGDNGEIGKELFRYCMQKMEKLGMIPSFSTFVSLSEAEEVYVVAQDGNHIEDFRCNELYIPVYSYCRLRGHLGDWMVHLHEDGTVTANYD